jgi:hypothetical protein
MPLMQYLSFTLELFQCKNTLEGVAAQSIAPFHVSKNLRDYWLQLPPSSGTPVGSIVATGHSASPFAKLFPNAVARSR